MNLIRNRSLSKFRVTPLLYRAGKKSVVTVYPMGKLRSFEEGEDYGVTFIPKELYGFDHYSGKGSFDRLVVKPEGGVLRFEYAFNGEQEWIIIINSEELIRKKRAQIELHVYSLEEDLYGLTPYVGDLHVHSLGSDGDEDPVMVACNYRKEGFDFMCLTDHFTRKPSEDLIDSFQGVDLGLKLFHGEEVHTAEGSIHIVNFGGSFSVNDTLNENLEKLIAKFEKDETLPAGIDPVSFNLRKWIVDEIRRGGGMAILAHPYWVFRNTYHMSAQTLDYQIENGIYDAFELLGGLGVYENNLQCAYYDEKRAEGYRIPIVGSSDSHRTDPAGDFGISKTIVFSKDTEFESIKDSILNYRSVAIAKPHGESERVFGPYRMVKLARYLIDFYLPAHDELCVEEGIQMREYALGAPGAKEAVEALCARTEKYTKYLLYAEI